MEKQLGGHIAPIMPIAIVGDSSPALVDMTPVRSLETSFFYFDAYRLSTIRHCCQSD